MDQGAAALEAEIELALLGTRCCVPVCSKCYFEGPYCREKTELADPFDGLRRGLGARPCPGAAFKLWGVLADEAAACATCLLH